MLTAISRKPLLSTVAIGASGAFGAYITWKIGCPRKMGIASDLIMTIAAGILGVQIGEAAFSPLGFENQKNPRVNTLEGFLKVRRDATNIIKAYLLSAWHIAGVSFVGTEFVAPICRTTSFPTCFISTFFVGFLALCAINGASEVYQKHKNADVKHRYVLSAISLGAIGAYGVIFGSSIGYGHGLKSIIASSLAVGFIALYIGERFFGRYIKKEQEVGGVYRHGQFFNDQIGMINAVKYSFFAGAMLFKVDIIEHISKRCVFNVIGLSCSSLIKTASDLIAIGSIIFAIYKARVAYVAMEKTIKKWAVEDREFRIFKEDQLFKLEIVNLRTSSIQELSGYSKQIEKGLENFTKSEIVVEENEEFSFAVPKYQMDLLKDIGDWIAQPGCLDIPPQKANQEEGVISQVNRWLKSFIKNRSGSSVYDSSRSKAKLDHHFINWGCLSLLKGKNKLIWQIHLIESGNAIQIPLTNMIYKELPEWIENEFVLNLKLRKDLKTIVAKHDNGTLSDVEFYKFIDQFDLDVVTQATRMGEKFSVHLKPVIQAANSFFSKRASLSKSEWAVTLICTNGSNPLGGQHAGIVIEGIEKGRYFMRFAHLHIAKEDFKENKDKRGEISIVPLENPYKLTYTHRSQVWIKDSWAVKDMLEDIENQKSNPPILAECGRESIISALFVGKKVESCITWAIIKLKKAKIHLPDSYLKKVATLTSFYTPIPNHDP